MSRDELQEFIKKSDLPLSRIAKATNINRTLVSYYIHGHRDLSMIQKQKLKKFANDYARRWQS